MKGGRSERDKLGRCRSTKSIIPPSSIRRSTTIVYRTDRQALSTGWYCCMGQLATADTWFRTCYTSTFCTVVWQLARFLLTRSIAQSLGDSWASCTTTHQSRNNRSKRTQRQHTPHSNSFLQFHSTHFFISRFTIPSDASSYFSCWVVVSIKSASYCKWC